MKKKELDDGEDRQRERSRNKNCETSTGKYWGGRERERLGMKTLLREKEAFTSRPIQRDGE